MIQLNYPEPNFKLKKENNQNYLFDSIRKIWLLLTEEEWVRQNFVHYLTSVLQYPQALIALEKELLLNGMKKRFDILIYNENHQPWMMIECKASNIKLDRNTLQQVLRYNITLSVKFLLITNGPMTFCWLKEGEKLVSLEALPQWAKEFL